MDTRGPVFEFDRFELDARSGELRRDGAPVKLPPQPFKALTLLVERAGELVTRDELRVALWGDDRYVDFNAGLNFCMAQLRAALEDPAAESKVIVAVPRRGYRLVAAVRTRPMSSSDAAVEAKAPTLRRWWAAAAVIALAAVAAQAPAADPLRVIVPAARDLGALKQYQLAATGLAEAAPVDLPARVKRLEAAIEAEPRYADAYAALADARLIEGQYRVMSPQAAYASAKAAAMKALSIDPRHAEAHAMFAASVLYLEWDWAAAGAHFARAGTIGPPSPRVHQYYSRYLSASGRHEDAIRHARAALAAAPHSVSAQSDLGQALFFAGRVDEAFAACDEAAALLPAFVPAHACAAAAAAEAGRFDAAIAHGMSAPAPDESFWVARATRLERAAVHDIERDRRAVAIAAALAHAGRSAEALDWLERAANRRIDGMLFVRVHPAFRGLARDARFARILQRVGP